MRLTRRSWLGAVIAASVPFGVAGIAGSTHQASGQQGPQHGLTIGVPTQVRHYYPASGANLQPPRPNHAAPGPELTPIAAKGGPDTDGKPEHHADGHDRDPDHGRGTAQP
jgi:hypothetical protein